MAYHTTYYCISFYSILPLIFLFPSYFHLISVFMNTSVCVGDGACIWPMTVQECLYLFGGRRVVGRQQRSKCGNQGETEGVGKGIEGIKGGGKTGGGNEEEQWWSGGKGKPSKHFPVHFSSGRLN